MSDALPRLLKVEELDLKCLLFLLSVFRFSELPENSDRQHHYHQCHYLHCGLPPTTTGHSDYLLL